MAGRKKTPDHLKLVKGTAQKCRMNPEAPAANVGTATAPDWLSEQAAELFDQISATLLGMGIASPDDMHALALVASRLTARRFPFFAGGQHEDQSTGQFQRLGSWHGSRRD